MRTSERINEAVTAADRGDFGTALRIWRSLANEGNAQGQYSLGAMYFKGQCVTQDHNEAATWCLRAARQGNASAQYLLAWMIDHGSGIAQSDEEAAKWYRMAAEQGVAGAQGKLGLMYTRGRGVAQNDADAVMWYRKAADQGDTDAAFNLGVLERAGRGVTRDDVVHLAGSLSSRLVPHETYAEIFKSQGGELPIHGGWGYARENPCVIDKTNPAARRFVPFDGNAIRDMVILNRLRLELITSRPKGKRFGKLELVETGRSIHHHGSRDLEHLTFDVTALSELDMDRFYDPSGWPRDIHNPTFSQEKLARQLEPLRYRFTTEYWFDVTSYFQDAESSLSYNESDAIDNTVHLVTVIGNAYRAFPNIDGELERRDTVFRIDLDDAERRQRAPWGNLLGRKVLLREESDICARLLAEEITEAQAIESMTDLMEQYYDQKYSLSRNR